MAPRDTAVVLIVEDSPDDAFLLRKALEEGPAPKRIYVTRDGEEALAYLRREPPHEEAQRPQLILLDLGLPRVSGLGVLEAVKEDAALRSIPIVVITSSHEAQDVLDSYDRLATAVIEKPEDPAAFIEMVRTLEAFWLQTVQLPRTDD